MITYFNIDEVKESSSDFLKVCKEWLEKGFEYSPSEMLGVMQVLLKCLII